MVIIVCPIGNVLLLIIMVAILTIYVFQLSFTSKKSFRAFKLFYFDDDF